LTSGKSTSSLPLPTPTWSKHISLDYGFSLEYPGGWTLEERLGKPDAVEPKPSGFPSLGKVTVWAEDNNQENDIEKWFDNNLIPGTGRPKTGKEPEKIRVFINKNKVKILEAKNSFYSLIEYYLLADYAGKRIILAGYFPSKESPEEQASLVGVYSKIAESIELQE